MLAALLFLFFMFMTSHIVHKNSEHPSFGYPILNAIIDIGTALICGISTLFLAVLTWGGDLVLNSIAYFYLAGFLLAGFGIAAFPLLAMLIKSRMLNQNMFTESVRWYGEFLLAAMLSSPLFLNINW